MACSMRQSIQAACSSSGRSLAVRAAAPRGAWNSHSSNCNSIASRRAAAVLARSHKVQIEHEGKQYDLEVPDGKTILEVALDKGLDLPHDCKLGVCMTCPAKLVSGEVDQSGSMLSDDVAEKGYALLCMAVPQTDCKFMTVSEDELLEEQLCA